MHRDMKKNFQGVHKIVRFDVKIMYNYIILFIYFIKTTTTDPSYLGTKK